MTAILGNVHDDVVTSTVTIPSARTGSPTPDLAAPSTGGSLQMVTARLRQPREYMPLCTASDITDALGARTDLAGLAFIRAPANARLAAELRVLLEVYQSRMAGPTLRRGWPAPRRARNQPNLN